MADNIIIIGSDESAPLYRFLESRHHIGSISGVASSSLAGDELSIDRVTFTVNLENYRDTLYSPTGADAYQDTNDLLYAVKSELSDAAEKLRTLPYATPVRVYHDGELVGKFYSGEVKRLGLTEFSVTADSPLGVLDGQQHRGGVYSGITFLNLLIEIIGGRAGSASGDVIPVTGGAVDFYVTSAVASAKVYGWLPIATKRANIHQMLFAHSVNILKGNDGDMLFDYLTSVSATDVPDERIFINGAVTYTPPATRVELTEHSYVSLSTDEEVVLLNNTTGGTPADKTLVTFNDGPAHDLKTEGNLSIGSSGANWVVVTGVGVLKGKKYHHTTFVISADSDDQSAEEKIARVSNCTLVSPLNGEAVLERLLSYYLSAREIQSDLSVQSERPGTLIRFNSVFGELETAFIARMNYRLTSFMRANCTLIAGYSPASAGNEYKNVQLVTASGTWRVPSGATKIMVVLIGGGTGGGAGNDGEQAGGAPGTEDWSGTAPISWDGDGGYAGTGGAPGGAGSGGKIFRGTLEVTPGQSFSVSIGAGGAGAPRGSSIGSAGGNTTFGSLSSANGYSVLTGFTDLITGNTYGQSGTEGIYGADGDGPNGTTDIIVDGTRYTHGSRGEYLYDRHEASSSKYPASGSVSIYGGYGGGPAYKANGGEGKAGGGSMFLMHGSNPQIPTAGGGYTTYHIPSVAVVYGYIAVGGDGANAAAPPEETHPGRGGRGGNGGGGVGAFGSPASVGASAEQASGGVFYSENGNSGSDYIISGNGKSGPLGTPGQGSAGGAGAPGCVLIYY